MNSKCGCFFLLLAFFTLFIGTVAAVEEIEQEHIKSFSLDAPEGLSFSGVELYNLDPDSNTTIVLDNYGEIYTLQINSTKSWGFWWNFDVSLTTPNGSTEHKTLKSGTLSALNYDIHIQYNWQSLNSTVDTSYFDIDLYTGLLPLEATLQDYNPTKTTALQFSQVSATSTSYYDLLCFVVTPDEFETQLNNDPLAPLGELAGDFFSWTWDVFLDFVEKIPGVGPYLASILEIAALTIDSIVFYFDLLLIEYPETTFLTIESFVLGSAFCKRGNFWTKINRVCNAHLKIIELFINLAEAGVNIMSKIISAVADAINALKPV